LDINALPTSDVYGPDARAIQRFSRLESAIGKHLVPVIALALPMALVFVFLFAVSMSACGSGCGLLSAFILVPLAYTSLTMFVVAIAMLRGRRANREARRDLVVTNAMRMQSLKDWYVRGDILEPEYDSLRHKIEQIAGGSAPHLRAQDAAAFYGRAVPAFGATLVPALALFFLSFLALTDGEIVAVPFALVSLVGATGNGYAIYYALRHGRSLANAARILAARSLETIEAEESVLLRNANQRKTGTTTIAGPRATFKRFVGR
jgi:uncharacterized membrane protein